MNTNLRTVAAALGSLFCAMAAAQPYPNKSIRFVTVGSADAVPRIVAQEISGPLGQRVLIEEHPGASGTIGAEFVSRAPADGYTFLIATSTHMVTPNFYKLSYDILRDFEPVSLFGSTPFVLVSHPSLPVKTLKDLIKLAKANPGRLNYSATSAGATTMLIAEMFKSAAKVNIVHVPYKSVGAALTDAIAGQVLLSSTVAAAALAQIQAHKVRALAVSTPQRSAVLPDVPTFGEQGLPSVQGTGWFGLVAPARTPAAIITRMNAEVVKALRKPEVRKRILSLANDPVSNTPDEYMAYMKADIARWKLAIKEAGIKISVQP